MYAQAGQRAGDGYALSYRSHPEGSDLTHASVVLLDTSGQPVAGPWPHSSGEHPGYTPTLIWSGSRYLIATGYSDCTGPPDCPDKLTLERVRLPTATDATGGLESVWGHSPAGSTKLPVLGSHHGETWMTWTEHEGLEPEGIPRTLYLQQLAGDGTRLGEATNLADGVTSFRQSLVAAPLGVVVAYAEKLDEQIDWYEVGHSHIVIHHRDADGQPRSEPTTIETTGQSGRPALVTVGSPRSVIVGWPTRGAHGRDEIKAAVLHCEE